jgi:hypothetical protein
MRRQVYQTDVMSFTCWYRHLPSEAILQPIREFDRPLCDQARQNLTGERLGNGADAEERVSIRGSTRSIGDFAEAEECTLAAAHHSEQERRHVDLLVEDRPGELNRVFEQLVLGTSARAQDKKRGQNARANTNYCSSGHSGLVMANPGLAQHSS